VVHGTVTSASAGAITLQVDRVLKGTSGETLSVYTGPGRGGSGGTAVATSVDYYMTRGSDHVVYVVRGADGQLETNACIGSHSGQPTAEETAYFGPGTPPSGSGGTATETSSVPSFATLAGALLAASALAVLAALWATGRIRPGRGAPAQLSRGDEGDAPEDHSDSPQRA
jgi:hypothetical protein